MKAYNGTWWNVLYADAYGMANTTEETYSEDIVDACFEMILKLKEMNLL